jgi:hypothetical protein
MYVTGAAVGVELETEELVALLLFCKNLLKFLLLFSLKNLSLASLVDGLVLLGHTVWFMGVRLTPGANIIIEGSVQTIHAGLTLVAVGAAWLTVKYLWQ